MQLITLKRTILILGLFIFAYAGLSLWTPKEKGGIPKMDFNAFEPILHQDNDTVYVINFWATWCKPCVKELPDFEKLNAEYKNQKVKVILVSLDFPNQHEQLLVPFVEENRLRSGIIHLTDVDANKWINKVDPGWSGAIPATLVYKGKNREFHEAQLNYEKLKSIVEPKL